jgi:16S rRNA processing protein RimM
MWGASLSGFRRELGRDASFVLAPNYTPPSMSADPNTSKPAGAPNEALPADDPDVEIGLIVGVFGIRGEVKVEPYADSATRYSLLKRVTAVWPDGSRRALMVASAHKHKLHILVRFDGVGTPELAAQFRGAKLVIPLSERPALPLGQYYVSDLLGLTVVTTAGEEIGPIKDVLQTPANDIYVTDRGMIPAVKEYIREVDLDRRRVVVAVVDGMFE